MLIEKPYGNWAPTLCSCFIPVLSKFSLGICFDNGFKFFDRMYTGVLKYRGSYKFKKHFMGPDHVPAFDGVEGGEKEKRAMVIDNLPDLKY